MYGGGNLWAKYAGIPFVFIVIPVRSFWRGRRRRRPHRWHVWQSELSGELRELSGELIEIRLARCRSYTKSPILKAGYDAAASLQVLIIAFDKYFSRSRETNVPVICPYDHADPCVPVFHGLCIDEQKAANDAERANSVIEWIIVPRHARVACCSMELFVSEVEL